MSSRKALLDVLGGLICALVAYALCRWVVDTGENLSESSAVVVGILAAWTGVRM